MTAAIHFLALIGAVVVALFLLLVASGIYYAIIAPSDVQMYCMCEACGGCL